MDYREIIIATQKWQLGGAVAFPVHCAKCGAERWVREATRPVFEAGALVLCRDCTVLDMLDATAAGESFDIMGPHDPRRKLWEVRQ